MVDRIELFSQVFWLSSFFWVIYLHVVFIVLPYIGINLKVRSKLLYLIINNLLITFKSIIWLNTYAVFFFKKSIEDLKLLHLKNRLIYASLEASAFEICIFVFNIAKILLKFCESVLFWGLETKMSFDFNINERAFLYPWLI